jgi:hypothetical protein
MDQRRTVECWVKRADLLGSEIARHVISQYESSSEFWSIYLDESTDLLTAKFKDSGIDETMTCTLDDTEWHHVAIVKNSWKWGLYLDGIQKAYLYELTSVVASAELCIGNREVGGAAVLAWDGWIDEVRLCKDNVYNADPNVGLTDTITVPTQAFGTGSAMVSKSRPFIEFNGGFDAGTTVWEAAMEVCKMSRCILLPVGTQISLAIDKSTSPTQMFSVGSIAVDSFKETFMPEEERAGEIEIVYRDEERDFARTQFTVVNSAIDRPSNKIRMDMFGITDAAMAEEMGNFLLLNNQLLKRTIEFEVDIDAIVCMVGDVIYVQHDVPDWGGMTDSSGRYGGGGRVVSCNNTGNATLVLDRALNMDLDSTGSVYELMVRISADDSIETKTVVDYDLDTNTITVSGTFTTSPVEWDVFAVGEQNLVTKEYRITGMVRTSDQKIGIRAMEYNEAIYAGDP